MVCVAGVNDEEPVGERVSGRKSGGLNSPLISRSPTPNPPPPSHLHRLVCLSKQGLVRN